MTTLALLWLLGAEPATLVADVDFVFSAQNGMGWVSQEGHVTITLTLGEKTGTLKVAGRMKAVDAVLIGKKGLATKPTEGPRDDTFTLAEVTRSGAVRSFRFDAFGDHLTGSCAPIEQPRYECTFTGFAAREMANLPELHLPLVLEPPRKGKRLVNLLTGKPDPRFGSRVLSER